MGAVAMSEQVDGDGDGGPVELALVAIWDAPYEQWLAWWLTTVYSACHQGSASAIEVRPGGDGPTSETWPLAEKPNGPHGPQEPR